MPTPFGGTHNIVVVQDNGQIVVFDDTLGIGFPAFGSIIGSSGGQFASDGGHNLYLYSDVSSQLDYRINATGGTLTLGSFPVAHGQIAYDSQHTYILGIDSTGTPHPYVLAVSTATGVSAGSRYNYGTSEILRGIVLHTDGNLYVTRTHTDTFGAHTFFLDTLLIDGSFNVTLSTSTALTYEGFQLYSAASTNSLYILSQENAPSATSWGVKSIHFSSGVIVVGTYHRIDTGATLIPDSPVLANDDINLYIGMQSPLTPGVAGFFTYNFSGETHTSTFISGTDNSLHGITVLDSLGRLWIAIDKNGTGASGGFYVYDLGLMTLVDSTNNVYGDIGVFSSAIDFTFSSTQTLNPIGLASLGSVNTPFLIYPQIILPAGVVEETIPITAAVELQSLIFLPVTVSEVQPFTYASETRIPQTRPHTNLDRVVMFASVAASEGHENLVVRTYTYGPFVEYVRPIVYQQTELFKTSVSVEADTCNVYRPRLLKYLPDEFSIKDFDDDLSQYLQVVAISMDEFYCFIQDFTTLFDPDRCDPKYLTYLAKLINWPLNTRGFDSTVPSIQEASISRARKQLREAVEVYKRKGLKEAFQILFYALGYYIELVELWTNNYVNFVEDIPADETMYDPINNPNGWYKSPYFGVRITSLNQSIEVSTGGEGQPWSFSADDLHELLQAVDSIRPVHTVLYWLNYYFDLVEQFSFTDLDMENGISWEPTDEFFNCTAGDPVYLRDDRRLDGITRNGTDSLLIRHNRNPQPAVCDPDLSISAELSDIVWIPDPWCTPQLRDGGVLYRDGFNLNPRNGSMDNRDPSAFAGRNGGFRKDTPLAAFDPSNENDLVWNRGGCYGPSVSKMTPLYQLDEEAQDGLTLFYNQFEFNSWLDRQTLGFGPLPYLNTVGHPKDMQRNVSGVADARTMKGSMLVGGTTDMYSAFGIDAGGVFRNTLSHYVFSGLTLQSVSTVTTNGICAYAGAIGFNNGLIYVVGGRRGSNGVATQTTNSLLIEVDPSTGNTTTYAIGVLTATFPAYVQVGSTLYVIATGATLKIIDLTNKVVLNTIALPDTFSTATSLVYSNGYIYMYGGRDAISSVVLPSLYRMNTTTNLFDKLPDSPFVRADGVLGHNIGLVNNNALYFLETTGNWSALPVGTGLDTYLKFNLATSAWSYGAMLDALSTDHAQYVPFDGRYYGAGGSLSVTASSAIQILDFLIR
jgi:hypothetical protein